MSHIYALNTNSSHTTINVSEIVHANLFLLSCPNIFVCDDILIQL